MNPERDFESMSVPEKMSANEEYYEEVARGLEPRELSDEEIEGSSIPSSSEREAIGKKDDSRFKFPRQVGKEMAKEQKTLPKQDRKDVRRKEGRTLN